MSAPAVTVSLVICTRDRAEYVGACLDAVASITSAAPWELVLVDNGSSDGTRALLERYAGHAPFPVTVVQEPRPGLGRARNAGVAAARGALLVFTDDDCYPAPDFLDAWARVFHQPEIGWGGGRIVLHDPADYPITVTWLDAATPLPAGAYIPPGVVQGANMAFRRPVMERVGGFDPDLGPGGIFNFEDLDMASRASAAGYHGGFFTGPTVRHHHRRRAGAAVEALRRSYDHGRGAYHASLLLHAGWRRHALAAWRDSVQGHLSHGRVRQLGRELAGAVHYGAYRLQRRAPRAGGG